MPWFWFFWALLALCAAQFFVFRDIRAERDQAVAKLQGEQGAPVAVNVTVENSPGTTINLPPTGETSAPSGRGDEPSTD